MPKAKKGWEEVKQKNVIKEAFILYIKAKRPIWDLTDKGYKNLHLKMSLWSEVLEHLKSEFDPETLTSLSMNTIEGIKQMWKNLRSTFQAKKKERKGKSGNGSEDIPKPWIWHELMSFLGDSKDSSLDHLTTSSLILTDQKPIGVLIAEAQADGQVKCPSRKIKTNILLLHNLSVLVSRENNWKTKMT